MKKKNEILLAILILAFGVFSLFFYKQSQSITTVDEINYVEKGGIDYKVYLNDKKYYNKDYLEEGMQYISSIIDYLDVNFKYAVSFDDTRKYNVKRKLTAHVKIVDTDNNDKIIYEKKETIKEDSATTETIDYVDNFKIDYTKYNKLANEFKTTYGISAKCNLFLDYIVDYEGKDDDLSQNKVLSLRVPLSEQMINIKKTEDVYNESSYVGKSKNSPVNVIMFILAVIFLILTIVGIVILIIAIINRIKNESKYNRFVNKVLRENDAYITIAKEDYVDKTKNTINIDNFKELMDVRNNIEKPIIFVKINNDTCKFLIVADEIYEYVATRKDFDN